MNTFKTGYTFHNKNFKNEKQSPFKTNVNDPEVIDGEYKVIKDDKKN